MFEPIPELDPDLEWMLLSGQANQPMLLDALLEEHGTAVTALARALLGEASLARQAAEDTFTAALLNVHRYRSAEGVRVWLFRLALDHCQKVLRQAQMRRLFAFLTTGKQAAAAPTTPVDPLAEDALGQALDGLSWAARTALLLHHGFEWDAAEIAAVLSDSPAETAARLERARGKLRAAAGEIPEPGFAEYLADTLRRRWVAAQSERLDETEILARARQRATRQKRTASLQEITWVGGALLLVASAIWGFNLLVPEPEPGELAATRPATSVAQASPAVATGTPTPESTAIPNRRRTSESVVYFVQPGDTMESIAAALGLAEDLLRAFNNLGPAQEVEPGQELVVPLDVPSGPRPSPTPVTPAPQPEPLTLASTSQEIYDRLVQNGNFWHTLWVDVQFLEYGPRGYIGPSKNYRIQNWFSPPRQMLGLAGFLDGEPRSAYLMNGLRGYMISLVPESEGRYNPTTAFAGLELRNRLFFNRSSLLSFSGAFEVVALEQVAGREALVVEWRQANGHREQLWVDALTGVILRHLEYAPGLSAGGDEAGAEEAILLSEFVVTGIAYDVDFPASLFDPQTPWSGGFAASVDGQQPDPGQQPSGSFAAATPTVAAPPPVSRQPLPYATPPADFDPSEERLTFQYAHSFNSAFLRASLHNSLADLFAGSYYLGSVETGSPWDLACDRSADGRLIAFANTGLAANPANLHWLDLGQVGEVRSTDYAQGGVTQFAFSPDSEQIALFWQPHRQNPVRRAIRTGVFGALVLLDTRTGEPRQLLELIDAKSLVWSPDGQSLALIGRMNGRDGMDEHVMVVNVEDGQVVYSRSIDYNSGNTTDWPVLDWGVDFPIDETPGLENCTR